MNTEPLHTSAWIKVALVLLMMATGLEVKAAPAPCTVVAVTDGATLSVRCNDDAGAKTIRLADVDAPAPQALFRGRAERSLSDLLLQKQVMVEVVNVDADGEPAAQVYLGATHVNASVVGNGMARCHGGTSKGGWCEREEANARSNLRGLWSDPWLTVRATGNAPQPAKKPEQAT